MRKRVSIVCGNLLPLYYSSGAAKKLLWSPLALPASMYGSHWKGILVGISEQQKTSRPYLSGFMADIGCVCMCAHKPHSHRTFRVKHYDISLNSHGFSWHLRLLCALLLPLCTFVAPSLPLFKIWASASHLFWGRVAILGEALVGTWDSHLLPWNNLVVWDVQAGKERQDLHSLLPWGIMEVRDTLEPSHLAWALHCMMNSRQQGPDAQGRLHLSKAHLARREMLLPILGWGAKTCVGLHPQGNKGCDKSEKFLKKGFRNAND